LLSKCFNSSCFLLNPGFCYFLFFIDFPIFHHVFCFFLFFTDFSGGFHQFFSEILGKLGDFSPFSVPFSNPPGLCTVRNVTNGTASPASPAPAAASVLALVPQAWSSIKQLARSYGFDMF
jgi:hypothetical protein